MSSSLLARLPFAVAGALALLGGIWLASPAPTHGVALRLPGEDRAATSGPATPPADLAGVFTPGQGVASSVSGEWPGFRGKARDGASGEHLDPLTWPPQGPQKLWEIPVGEGYASPAIADGKAYLLDYDALAYRDVIRCLSLDDGKDLWQRAYKSDVKRNHGMSRTVPAVGEGYVVTFGPKCQVVCLDARTGDYKWGMDLVRQYGAKVPPWYAGQCPLIDRGRVILAPSGTALLLAVELSSGRVLWSTPNPQAWTQTHTSITPMDYDGRRMYVYVGSGGVVGVDAETGVPLWQTSEWRVKIAAVPSPVVVDASHLFLSGGYEAGAMMLQLSGPASAIHPNVAWKTPPDVFGAEQQTPICHGGQIFGVIPGGQLVCLGLDGKQKWNSGSAHFGIGPYLIAGEVMLLMNDSGKLTAVQLNAQQYRPLGAWTIFEEGHEAWGPMSLVPGRLMLRDLRRLACLNVGGS